MIHKNYQKPKSSGSIRTAVNGKFGIPSESLVKSNSLIRHTCTTKRPKTGGLYMSRPKSSWSNPQMAPPLFSLELSEVSNIANNISQYRASSRVG